MFHVLAVYIPCLEYTHFRLFFTFFSATTTTAPTTAIVPLLILLSVLLLLVLLLLPLLTLFLILHVLSLILHLLLLFIFLLYALVARFLHMSPSHHEVPRCVLRLANLVGSFWKLQHLRLLFRGLLGELLTVTLVGWVSIGGVLSTVALVVVGVLAHYL